MCTEVVEAWLRYTHRTLLWSRLLSLHFPPIVWAFLSQHVNLVLSKSFEKRPELHKMPPPQPTAQSRMWIRSVSGLQTVCFSATDDGFKVPAVTFARDSEARCGAGDLGSHQKQCHRSFREICGINLFLMTLLSEPPSPRALSFMQESSAEVWPLPHSTACGSLSTGPVELAWLRSQNTRPPRTRWAKRGPVQPTWRKRGAA